MRDNNREAGQLRPVKMIRGWNRQAEGSVLIESGNTRVLCNASVEDRVPPFMKDSGRGWVTAEYSMIPRAGNRRDQRAAVKGKQKGRTMEIQRLIGRSLRAVIDLEALDGFTITIDCDVLQADGGTRTASITGAFVALADAVSVMKSKKMIRRNPLKEHIAATSAGIFNGSALLDLCYVEDSMAEVDMNVVMTESGKLVEVQGTGESSTFTRDQMLKMLDLCESGIKELIQIQKKTLEGAAPSRLEA